MNYSVKAAVGGGFVVLCNGTEIATAKTIREAAKRCADDALEADPEATPTVVYDVAAAIGQMVGNVKHMMWFRDAVAEEIMAYWELSDEQV